LYFVAGDVNM